MIRKVLEMEDKHEIRNAHEIVDKIYPLHEREAVRKLLPPRPEVTFGEAIEELKGLASEDDMHLWAIVRHLERFADIPVRYPESAEEYQDVPEGSLAVKDGDTLVWVKNKAGKWYTPGYIPELPLLLSDEDMTESKFRILRWGYGGN